MSTRPDPSATRAVDRLQLAVSNYERARRKMDRAELERARAVLDARAAGMTTRQIAAVLGVTQPRVMALSRWGEGRGLTSRPEASAVRGAPEPTPVGVLLARALEVVPAEPPAPVVDELVEACPAAAEPEESVTGCAELGCAAEPEASVNVCVRAGCDRPVYRARLCERHFLYG